MVPVNPSSPSSVGHSWAPFSHTTHYPLHQVPKVSDGRKEPEGPEEVDGGSVTHSSLRTPASGSASGTVYDNRGPSFSIIFYLFFLSLLIENEGPPQ